MRCPKCHYLSFDSSERCRNCGYDFSLAADTVSPDLSIRRDSEPIGPLANLTLKKGSSAPPGDSAGRRQRHVQPDAAPGDTSARAPSDLPLFHEADLGGLEDVPLVTPAPPRPPLAVRRATPDASRLQPRAARLTDEAPALDLFPGKPEPVDRAVEPVEAREAGARIADSPTTTPLPAGVVRRITAALIDAGILLVIDGTVLYFTLQLAGLAPAEVGLLPVAPVAGFYLMLNGGYFVAFTASVGQTIGKMALRIQVVAEDGGRVRFGQAVVRTVAYLISALPLGLGFLPGLLGEGRTLHDRLASTRVVRVA